MECSICFDDLTPENNGSFLCGHDGVCVSCVKKVKQTQNTCPFCRQKQTISIRCVSPLFGPTTIEIDPDSESLSLFELIKVAYQYPPRRIVFSGVPIDPHLTIGEQGMKDQSIVMVQSL
jgi:hypothetical protein